MEHKKTNFIMKNNSFSFYFNLTTKNKLSKINSKDSIISIINNTKENQKKVTGWRIVEGKKQTVDLYIRVIRLFRNEFVVRVKEDKNESLFKKLHISLESFNIFF